jgi:phosphopantetheinyl transferase (holo-ACP synthase)
MTSDDISELERLLASKDDCMVWRLRAAARNALPELLAMARRLFNAEREAEGARYAHEHTRSDLLATRRALKLAQAKAMGHLARRFMVRGNCERVIRLREKMFRGASLCRHYAAKFEREAGEVK